MKASSQIADLCHEWREPRSGLIIGIAAVIGLILLSAITVWAWTIASMASQERNLATFNAIVADSEHAMLGRLNSYSQSLDGGAALFQTAGEVSLDEWRTYVDVLNIEKTLPGINGIGFIEPVSRQTTGHFFESLKKRGVRNLQIHPVTDLPEKLPITYIEPIEPNLKAVGLDIAFESNRRQAAYHARDSGKSTITKRIFLVQDQTRSAGFLLLRPTYEQGLPLNTTAQRRRAFRGWIYAPFIASRFMQGLTTSQGAQFDFEVFDGKEAEAADRIFSSTGAQEANRTPLYSVSQTLRVMEQDWTVVWKSTPEFEASVSTQEPLLILLGGLIVTSAFGIMMFFYARRDSYVRNEVETKTQELVAKEREVRRALDKAETATQAKSQFLANMSHEIRTPMNGVIGFTQLLDDGTLNQDQQRYVQMISDSGSAMMSLLNDILDISKVDAGLMVINEAPVDVQHILENCISLVSPNAETKNIQLQLEISKNLPSLVKLDGLRLRQVVLNLLANAVKFTEKGSVTVEVHYERGRTLPSGTGDPASLSIVVTDTGKGISPDRQRAIFEPFTQEDDSTERKYGGTGLGLTISNQLIQLMGGEITMTSELGEGSAFTISLPAEACSEEKTRGISAEGLPADDGDAGEADDKPRILIAEDHDINQMLLGEMLEKLGYAHDVASDGAKALARVRQAAAENRQYDAVLMDIQMPEIDGIKATELIRAEGMDSSQLPIIALTANAYPQDVENCLKAGMQAHLAKPFAIEDLETLLEIWIANTRHSRAA